MEILTPLQKKVLKAIGDTDLPGDFYLTGGTALSAFYLKHRRSEDLDFFTGVPGRVRVVLGTLEKVGKNLGLKLEMLREFDTYIDVIFSEPGGVSVRCDFAQDSPYRLEKPIYNDEYRIYVDSLVDICCNKLSALYDRGEAKDFVDVYFLAKEYRYFSEMIKLAKKKHVGFDEYWLAAALRQVATINVLPTMIKPITVEELIRFFEKETAALLGRLRTE